MKSALSFGLVFWIKGSAGTVYELPLWHDDAGSFTVDATAVNCVPSVPRRFPIKVKMYDFSVIEEQYNGCEITLPSLSDRSLRFRDGLVTTSFLAGHSVLGIGPGSAAANQGVDIVVSGGLNSPAILRLGTSFSQFESVCHPDTLVVVPTERSGAISDVVVRFDLVDPLSGLRFNTTHAPEPVELEFVGPNSLASFPESLASRLDDILVAHGAIRTSSSDQQLWSYTNCTLSELPNLAIEFYSRNVDEGGMVGVIELIPDEFMPACEFHVAEEGLMPSLDIFKLPYINKRIGTSEIYLCESPISS